MQEGNVVVLEYLNVSGGRYVCVENEPKRSPKTFSIHIPKYFRYNTFLAILKLYTHAYIPKLTANFRYKKGIKNIYTAYASISLPKFYVW